MDMIHQLEEALSLAQEQMEGQMAAEVMEADMDAAQEQLAKQQQEVATLRSRCAVERGGGGAGSRHCLLRSGLALFGSPRGCGRGCGAPANLDRATAPAGSMQLLLATSPTPNAHARPAGWTLARS
jgi:hypothetical protein